MGVRRNGARSFLELLAKVCKLSHMPGFQAGLTQIVGNSNAQNVMDVFVPLCQVIETLVSLDNVFNQVDHFPENSGDEDREPLG